jgi:pSer/pThr/pTyr-binding forkhead associated (FHA) protein
MIALVITVIGASLAILRLVQVMQRAISVDAFAAISEKMLKEGNLDRLGRLCAGARGSPLAAAVGALAKTRALPRGTTEIVASDTLRVMFVEAFTTAAHPLVVGRYVALAAFFALVTPAAWLATSGAATTTLLLTAASGLVVLAWSVWIARGIFASGPVMLERLLPKITPLLLAGPPTYREAEVSSPIDDAPKRPQKPERPAPPPDLGGFVVDVRRNGASEGTQTFDVAIIKIGRHEGAHLRLDDPDVARMHAVVERDDDAVTIIDLGSATGTRVNGETITKTKLATGDVISIGPYELVVSIGKPAVPASPEASSAIAEPPAPSMGDDPRTWADATIALYTFDTRSPDLFYEVATTIARGTGVRLAKIRRESAPQYVVALIGSENDVAVVRKRIERESASQYARFATPASEIAPDAVHGPETRDYATLRGEIVSGLATVLVTGRP